MTTHTTSPAQLLFEQKTIQTAITMHGIGLHSGVPVKMKLCPAPPNSGLMFIRTDLNSQPHNTAEIHLQQLGAKAVSNTQLCSLISNQQGVQLGTIEHLMAALHVFGITNLRIEVDAAELPVMDGSSAPFVHALQQAGVVAQHGHVRPMTVAEPFVISQTAADGSGVIASVKAHPADRFIVHITIDFKHPQMPEETATFVVNEHTFLQDIQHARTFCFEKDIVAMHDAGLAKGGSLHNAVVMGEHEVLNPEGFRYTVKPSRKTDSFIDNTSEMIRHKTLDIIGDLYIAGRPVVGEFFFTYPGHSLNNLLLRRLTGC